MSVMAGLICPPLVGIVMSSPAKRPTPQPKAYATSLDFVGFSGSPVRVDWLKSVVEVDRGLERGRRIIHQRQEHGEAEEYCRVKGRRASLASHLHVRDETDGDHDENAGALSGIALKRLGHLERERLHLVIVLLSDHWLALDVDIWVDRTHEVGAA